MSWWKAGERRQIVDWPDGRDWRCLLERGGCGYREPEDARPEDVRCPGCGERLHRVTVRL